MVLGKLTIHMWKNETRLIFLTPYKNNFKVDQRTKLRPETLKLLGKKNQDIETSKKFLNRTPVVQEIKSRINKGGYMILKELLCKQRGQPTE